MTGREAVVIMLVVLLVLVGIGVARGEEAATFKFPMCKYGNDEKTDIPTVLLILKVRTLHCVGGAFNRSWDLPIIKTAESVGLAGLEGDICFKENIKKIWMTNVEVNGHIESCQRDQFCEVIEVFDITYKKHLH